MNKCPYIVLLNISYHTHSSVWVWTSSYPIMSDQIPWSVWIWWFVTWCPAVVLFPFHILVQWLCWSVTWDCCGLVCNIISPSSRLSSLKVIKLWHLGRCHVFLIFLSLLFPCWYNHVLRLCQEKVLFYCKKGKSLLLHRRRRFHYDSSLCLLYSSGKIWH